MRLHIVRHGQTDWNAERRIQGQLESQLDEIGIAQAIDRGNDLRAIRFHTVYSSSSRRTRQTTHHLLNGQDYNIVYLDELREVRLGIWEGHLWQDIESRYPHMVQAHLNASDNFEVEGAEKARETQARGVEAIESIIRTHETDDKNCELLIVSHGAIMKCILAHYTGVPLGELCQLPSLPNCAHCIIAAEHNIRNVEQIAGEDIASTPWHTYLNN